MSRVLVVDDDPGVARALARILRRSHEVTTAHSPRLALEAIAAGDEVDAIVTDVVMPELDGVEFYRAVRSLRPELARRFVFVTGTDARAREDFFLDKIVVMKPVSRESLLDAVARVLF